ncbi:MAG TPA: hypothetical protein VIM79_21770 [Niastella sp.]
MSGKYLLFFAAMLCWCCRPPRPFPYAIKDFSPSLQPFLTYKVSKAFVGFDDDSLSNMMTDKELTQLSRCEHPVLRAIAFREMLERRSFDHFRVVMEHLHDTAIVAVNEGEWGLGYRTIADDIIRNAGWKTNEDKNKTIDAVLTKHNYLRAAYTILLTYEPQEKHYSFIQDMALRDNGSVGNFNVFRSDKELALYGLAKFKKKKDVPVIKDILLSSVHSLGEVSWNLMSRYPNNEYLEVFEAYYPRLFYRTICRERSATEAINFIHSVAVYKNERSARILDSILNRKPFLNCEADTSYLKSVVRNAIWYNPCPAYAKLRAQIEARVKEDLKNALDIEPAHPIESTDSSEEKIRW